MSPISPFQRLLFATVYGCALLESPMFQQSAFAQQAPAGEFTLGACNPATQVWPIGQIHPGTQDQFGNTCVSGGAGGGGGGTVSQGAPGGSAWPVSISGAVAATLSGAVGQGTPGGSAWPVSVSGTATVTGSVVAAQGASGATAWPVTVSGSPTVNQGTAGGSAWPITVSGTPTVNQGSASPAASAWPTYSAPQTAGGTSTYDSAATGITNTVVSVKTTAGLLYGYHIGNPSTVSGCYLSIYNTASGSITVGTTQPLKTLFIPAGGGAIKSNNPGSTFSTAIAIAATVSANASGVCVSGLNVNLDYQ